MMLMEQMSMFDNWSSASEGFLCGICVPSHQRFVTYFTVTITIEYFLEEFVIQSLLFVLILCPDFIGIIRE